MEKTIYDLELHEGITTGEGLYYRRVPGGWVYEIYCRSTDSWDHVFIPFNNEFEEKPKERIALLSWLIDYEPKTSARLHGILLKMARKYSYIDEVTRETMAIKDLGTWPELQKLLNNG